jgi:hypothetical protein
MRDWNRIGVLAAQGQTNNILATINRVRGNTALLMPCLTRNTIGPADILEIIDSKLRGNGADKVASMIAAEAAI